MEKLNVAIIFGGCSPEDSVSLDSAHAVITHLDQTKYNPVLIGISDAGSWYHFTGEVKKIKLDTWNNPSECSPAMVSPDQDSHALLVMKDGAAETISPFTFRVVECLVFKFLVKMTDRATAPL